MAQENQENLQRRSPSAVLPRDTNAALQGVMSTIKTLEQVYQEENKVLNKMDSKGFIALQDRKLNAARDYQNVMGQILSRKNEIAKADPAVKQRLKDAHAEFSEISRKNLEAIERMQRCTERLGNTIRSAAIKSAQTQRSFSYGENGALSNSTQNKAVSSGLSETV